MSSHRVRARLDRFLSGLAWPALFFGILPLAVAFVVNNLRYYQTDEQHLAALDFFYYPASPGRWISALVGHEGDFLVTDIGPDGFLRAVVLFAVFNSAGWWLILATLRAGWRILGQRFWLRGAGNK